MKYFITAFLIGWITCMGLAQSIVLVNPLKETFQGKVQQVSSASYECSGDSLNPKKEAVKNEERLLNKRVYDQKGNLTEITYLHPDGKIKYRTVFTRDKKNNLVQEDNIMSTGRKSKSILRTFDKKGMMLSQATLNDSGKVVEKIIRSYKDTLKTMECILNADSTCRIKIEYKRDKKGKLLEQIWYDSDCKTILSKVSMQYDEKNNPTGSKTTTPDGELIVKRTFTYDAAHRLTSRTDYDSKKTLLKHFEYVYDDKGMLRQEIESGRNGELQLKILYNYDSKGRIDWEYRFSNARDIDMYVYYKYDEYNNLVQRKQVRASTLPQFDSLVYEYDKQGNWIKRTLFRASRPVQIDERTITYY